MSENKKRTADIPKDIRRYVFNKRLRRVMYCAFITLILSLPGIVFSGMLLKWGTGVFGLYFVFAAAVSVLVARIPAMLKDKSFSGIVREVKIYRIKERKQWGGISPNTFYQRLSVWLTIETDTGEIMRREAIHDLEEHEKSLRGTRYAYREGMRVIYFSGTNYLHIVTCEERETVNCVICGDNFPKENEKCLKCGYSLHIKNNYE